MACAEGAVVIQKVFIGFDESEYKPHLVACQSLHTHAHTRHDVRRLSLLELMGKGLYTRPTTQIEKGQLWDAISEAPMSTGHAIARFFVPYLCGYQGWALFTDGDVLFREDIEQLFALKDEKYAVMVVKHPPLAEQATKKDGHTQTAYARKNWSSVMLFNCGHPANLALNGDILNTWPGRDLHAFKWLTDEQIGELPAGWNYLVNVTPDAPYPVCLAHYTLGTPDVPGHELDAFAAEWRVAAKYAGFKQQVTA